MKKEIIAALIGGAALIIGALIHISPDFHKNNKSYNYLKIIDVSLNNSREIDGIRILGRVNNDYFTYPMNSFIVDPDNYLPIQLYKIKKLKDDFECYFEIMILDSTCRFHYLRPFEQFIVPINSFKYSDVYTVRLFEPYKIKSELECKIEFKIY